MEPPKQPNKKLIKIAQNYNKKMVYTAAQDLYKLWSSLIANQFYFPAPTTKQL